MVYNPFPWRSLLEGQVARIGVFDLTTKRTEFVYETDQAVIEAPNWTIDGRSLLFNRDGELFVIPATGSRPGGLADNSAEHGEVPVYTGELELANNDHVLDPDGGHVYTSQNDGHIYRVALVGREEPVRVTDPADGLDARYLHGVSPDGAVLAFIGGPELATLAPYNIYTFEMATGTLRQITDSDRRHDGAEFSPDGQWIYFNSERNSERIGHCQLFRMRPDGAEVTQLTFDDRVNWFPHPSPDNSKLAYLSYPPGTNGHPENLPIEVIITNDPLAREIDHRIELFGGQGTINVPSWSPDSRKLAFVDYPVSANRIDN
jgi:Tol biopolymer transport system component